MACEFPVAVKAKLMLDCYTVFTLLYFYFRSDQVPGRESLRQVELVFSFYRPDAFPVSQPNQQCQSIEGNAKHQSQPGN